MPPSTAFLPGTGLVNWKTPRLHGLKIVKKVIHNRQNQVVIREARHGRNKRIILNRGRRRVNLRVGEALYAKVNNYRHRKGIKSIPNKSSSSRLAITIAIICFRVMVIMAQSVKVKARGRLYALVTLAELLLVV